MKLFQKISKRSSSISQISLNDFLEYFNYNGLNYPLQLNQTQGAKTEEIGHDFSGLTDAAYKQNGVVFACLMVRQLLFQEARFQFRRYQSGRPGEYFGTRELLPLEQPWPNGTTGDLLARAIQDVDLAGNFYAVRMFNGLRRLRPDYVTIALGSKFDPEHAATAPDVEVAGYVYNPPDGETRVYGPKEVAHFAPYPDPQASFRGMSWLQPVIREIMGDQAATTHKLKYFEQGATPNMVVTFEPSVDADKVKTWIDMLEDKMGGAENAYRTLYLGGGADAKVVGSNLEQVDFKNVQGAGETRIAAAAGVPPVIVGLSEGLQAATYSNYSQARRRFADGTMRPLWRNFAGSMATVIRVPRNADLWYDDRDIPFLAEDVKDAAEVRSTDATAIKALTEAGYDPDSVVDAVTAGDLTRLAHSGMYSVQLQPPGSDNSPDNPDQMGRSLTRAKDASPPGEASMRALIGAFVSAERDIRELLTKAIKGRREKHLSDAISILAELRKEDPTEALQAAYADAYDDAALKVEEKAQGDAISDPIRPLTDALREKLDEGVSETESRLGKAFRSVTEENYDDVATSALVAHVDDANREWSLGSWADMTISTLGRRATSRGIVNAVGRGQVQVSSHGTTHPVCQPLEGVVFHAQAAPEPPFHPGCQHMLIPLT